MQFFSVLTAAWIASQSVSSAAAQPATPSAKSSADIAALVENLGADDWATREAADSELRALELPGLEPLAPFLGRADLSPEQVARLRSIALERFGREPHAGMGVSWDNSFRFGASRPSPVVIGQTVEGFDAAAKLRPGDAIAAMDGLPLSSQEEMRAAIISHSPGDTVTLTVFRGTLRLEISLTLGDFAALRMPEPPSDATLARALELRLQRSASDGLSRGPRVIGGLSAAQWFEAGAHNPRNISVFLPGDDQELAAILVGGEGRGAWPSPISGQARPTIRFAPGVRTSPERPGATPAGPRNGPIIPPTVQPPTTGPRPPAAQPPAPRPAPRPPA